MAGTPQPLLLHFQDQLFLVPFCLFCLRYGLLGSNLVGLVAFLHASALKQYEYRKSESEGGEK
jgi:hypothetical protein